MAERSYLYALRVRIAPGFFVREKLARCSLSVRREE